LTLRARSSTKTHDVQLSSFPPHWNISNRWSAATITFPLLEAAASLAQDEYPELDVQQVLGDVDQLLARLKRRLPNDAAPLARLRALNQFFFNDLNFGGNVNDYYDPDNSYLNAVLRTRRGIPISLAVLWIELAQGLGLQARGIGFPGHFMLKVTLPKGQVVIDPFTGKSLSREELGERLEPYKRSNGLVGDFDVPLGLYLQPASPREIIARMLRNLKEVHHAQEDWQRVIAVQDRLVVLLPDRLGRVPRPRLGACRAGQHRAGRARPRDLPGQGRGRAGHRRDRRARCRPAPNGQLMSAKAGVSPAPDLGTLHEFHGVQPVLPVSDVARAARWFRDVLGFEIDFVAGEPPSYARVKKGDRSYGDPVYLRLWQCNTRDAKPWRGEIVIHVGKDIDGLHAAYVKRGVTVVEPPVSQPWGLREFAIREPDGHVLRFCGYLA
jgi:regulator of sirC expression with transglutaminase-like and TPR domain/catechol 2,3-dioxygenase-like lactoylglutathione lyase family enzyme